MVGPRFPTNHVTGRAYNGINVLTLWLAAEEKGFSELRAEIGACFLTAATGLPDGGDLTNHAKYLESWLSAIQQGDSRYLFRAASAASKGVDFILGFSRPKSENETDDATAAAAA